MPHNLQAAECTIKLRMLDGSVVQHIFLSSATIGEVLSLPMSLGYEAQGSGEAVIV